MEKAKSITPFTSFKMEEEKRDKVTCTTFDLISTLKKGT